MGHAFVYVFVAFCGCFISAEDVLTEIYTSTEINKKDEGIDTPTSDFAVPGKPRNLTILDFTSESFYLQWANPEKKNGVIEGYRVYYMNNNFTEVQPDKIPFNEPLVRYNLTKLSKYLFYTNWICT